MFHDTFKNHETEIESKIFLAFALYYFYSIHTHLFIYLLIIIYDYFKLFLFLSWHYLNMSKMVSVWEESDLLK